MMLQLDLEAKFTEVVTGGNLDKSKLRLPHESHELLSQELLHVFGGGVLIATGIGAGLSVLGGILSGARVIAVSASKSYQKFIELNLNTWLREKKVVRGYILPEPQALVTYEQKKGIGQPQSQLLRRPLRIPDSHSQQRLLGRAFWVPLAMSQPSVRCVELLSPYCWMLLATF